MSQVGDRTFDGILGGPPPAGPGSGSHGRRGPGRRPPGSGGRSGRAGRYRPGYRWVLVAVMLLAVAAAVGGGGRLVLHRTTTSWSRQVTRVDGALPAEQSRPAVDPVAGKALNVLVLGSDSRSPASDPRQWTVGAQRTDAIMIAHLTSDRSGAFVMSIPRDSWVEVPGHGMAKINAALSWGGPALMMRTVEHLTGVRLDHFMIVDFNGFTKITDAIGGVRITVPEAVSSDKQGSIEAGTYTMNGQTALTYVRQRYNVPGGDVGRVKRQQNWIRAVALKMRALNPVTDPLTFNTVMSTLSTSTAVDQGFTPDLMRELAIDVRRMGPHDLRFFTVPLEGTGWSPDHTQAIVELDREAVDGLWLAIRQDRVGQWASAHKPDGLGHSVH